MKKRFYLLNLMMYLLPMSLYAQFSYRDVPPITLEDFKGVPPKDATFPVYINPRVYYRIDSVSQLPDGGFRVWIRTKVDLMKENSYFDTTRVNWESVEHTLTHEKGHLFLAFVAANKIEKKIAQMRFGNSYKDEVRKKFMELTEEYHKEDLKYDNQTDHSRNRDAQEKWNRKFEKLLPLSIK